MPAQIDLLPKGMFHLAPETAWRTGVPHKPLQPVSTGLGL